MFELVNFKSKVGLDNWECNFSFKAEENDIIGIIGSSGSGKSTLLNSLAGFIKPDEGEFLINGINSNPIKPGDRPISMMFQEHNLFTHLTVFDNIAIGITPNLKLTKEQIEQVFYSMEKVGLKGFNKRFPNDLSGGQRQRVAIARIMVRKRKLLLLDEPFSFLDPPLRLEMLDLIQEIQQENNFIVVIVTHDFCDCLRICNKTVFVDHGKVIYQDNTKMFLEKSINIPKINNYLKNVLVLQGHR
jgi:thiamine transport system ATP-binding protein